MEGLGKDVSSLIVKYLTLRCKRNLMQVSKSCYWWIHPYVIIYAVPKLGNFEPYKCRAMSVGDGSFCHGHINSKDVTEVNQFSTLECNYGHRTLCHKKDLKGSFYGVCPNCPRLLFDPDKKMTLECCNGHRVYSKPIDYETSCRICHEDMIVFVCKRRKK